MRYSSPITHHSLFIILLALAMMTSCSGDDHHRVRDAAEKSYRYLQKGKYEKFVGEIAYADSMSEDYRVQMIDLIKEYAVSQEMQHGKLVKVEATDDTIMDALAHVYLQISYADNTSEEVGVPMVRVDGDWKMQ